MDQARSTISKIFNGEPHSYTRFNLTQNMEGDNSQVEMKLSSDMDEEVGENGVGDNRNHNSNRKPYVAQKLGRTPKNLFFMAAATLLIFIIGYLIGYLVHRKKDLAPTCAASVVRFDEAVAHETGAAPLMDWNDVKKLLAQKVTAANFEPLFREFSSANHRAGSPDDDALANKVIKKFKEYGMKSWTDEHFVKVQDCPASGSNRVVFKNGSAMRPEGFLSYSATGEVTGAALYAYYGQDSDLMLLRDKSINLTGRVMLVRAGRISLAEKVANAAKMGAAAVLIYPDTDYSILDTTQLFGHVHMGSGDPYTPGFPSFNHTQFPPVQSSGLPKILAQTITAGMAIGILRQLGGQDVPTGWGGLHKLGEESDLITVEVNNILTEKKINNVFGVIKGFVDADRYVVIGAQRDAWGPGFAASTVGTSVLVELARSISDMVKNDGFKPRRSIVFASWSAGEYGSVGATEWLEGYVSSLSMKAFSYINLDGVITGQKRFKVAASPLMHSLIASTLNEVNLPNTAGTLASQFVKGSFESDVLVPMKLDNAAYPFLAFSGIPSVSFGFTSDNPYYPLFGTKLDTWEKLNLATGSQVPQLAEMATRFAGHMALRLVHDHLLRMDVMKYDKIIRLRVAQINMKVNAVQRMQPKLLPKDLTMQWLFSASGSYSRASRNLVADIQNSDLEDIEMCRIINDRIMAVERNLLSPFVSPRENPFRHILAGSGSHSVAALSDHLEALRIDNPEADADLFRNQFALATWTIQGCANSLAGDVWSLDNEI
ncbi:transferrin receptor 1a isoform X1 [Sander lucioperca]|uniref:Transferrin receptor protein 1 n=1 Tax=Sander lucioperca TaxID=283035 RepID=A0A8D0AFT8_SANLU|nr:transferrin receptor 1a isoform X1 [Sander lucioperca]XP_031149053.1 transferrin receptor 1a isoform X1 [Sander lucioperca]XP_031149064.1 transferrin receptor 1a isoform X1 [Sander lucioperca]XP_035861501.1 transferrin receptor 1a isoform X1 [Sander lucioperca]